MDYQTFSWQQLDPGQKTDIVLYMDQFEPVADWELIYASYVIENGEVCFAPESEH